MRKRNNEIRRQRMWLASIFLVLLLGGAFFWEARYQGQGTEAAVPVFNLLPLWDAWETERSDSGYFVLVDEAGNVLDETALQVYRGDEFIAADNRRYRIVQVEGDVAHCQFAGIEEMGEAGEIEAPEVVPAVTPAPGGGKPSVGIYHTHGGESYVPSQGTEDVRGKGGVAEVAATLQSRLQEMGINAVYDSTSHAPHDRGAYRRSRRTAAALVKQGVKVLVDVHRDAVPASAYRTKIDNKSVSKVKLVVGRQNPRMASNLGFAKQAKAILDKMHPGLVKGIFIGRGSYNQDLQPTTMLIEVGSHQLTLEEAKAGVTLFADVIPQLLGTSPTTGVTQVRTGADAGGSLKALGWILVALVIGVGGYLLISTGSWQGAAAKLRQMGSKEWGDIWGNKRDKS